MINPELQAFLDRWDQEWSSFDPKTGLPARRAHFEQVARNMKLDDPEDVDDSQVEWVPSAAGDVRVRIFKYASQSAQPCLIYMHGGAFMQGSPETHADITNRIASWNKQTVISVDYALAPENPFPAAIDQTGDVVRWAFANADRLGIDPRKIAVGGDSAGANLAAAAALDLRGEIELIGQLLIYPACDFDTDRPSYRENPDGPIITVAGMPTVNAMYCPNPADLESPRAAPLLAQSHEGLPSCFMAVAEHDPLRDSGLAYAEALEQAGVPVETDMGTGLIHGYLRAMEFCGDSVEKLKKMSAWLHDRNVA